MDSQTQQPPDTDNSLCSKYRPGGGFIYVTASPSASTYDAAQNFLTQSCAPRSRPPSRLSTKHAHPMQRPVTIHRHKSGSHERLPRKKLTRPPVAKIKLYSAILAKSLPSPRPRYTNRCPCFEFSRVIVELRDGMWKGLGK